LTTRRAAGRRPGGPDTRGEILEAARESFASKGFEGTTLRGVARAAGVDPALVHHYFEGKDALFVAAMELPVDPSQIADAILAGPMESIGERVIRNFVEAWEAPPTRLRMRVVLGAAMANPAMAHTMRDAVTRMILDRVAERLDVPDARFRLSLVASHLMGVAFVRYIMELEPLAGADPEEIVARVGPVLQAYLTGDQ
jgi:AcrR family transcriptional regulator